MDIDIDLDRIVTLKQYNWMSNYIEGCEEDGEVEGVFVHCHKGAVIVQSQHTDGKWYQYAVDELGEALQTAKGSVYDEDE